MTGNYVHPTLEIPGWTNGQELEWLYQRASENRTVVEVGSAYGKSAHALLQGNFRSFGEAGRVYCVDPWWGKNPETRRFDPDKKDLERRREFLLRLHGYPNLRIVELPITCSIFDILPRPDMVFLDCGVDNIPSALRMVLNSFKFNPVTLLCGHDYENKSPGVVAAVDHYFPDGINLVPGGSIWYRWASGKEPKRKGKE